MTFSFFFNDTTTTDIYTLSLHDALPISKERGGDGESYRGTRGDGKARRRLVDGVLRRRGAIVVEGAVRRSEEHTSELQSRVDLVCRLLLEKKKTSVGRCSKWDYSHTWSY